eukprot:TRINITY_DN18996_c0_g1_i1.p1 TRINITY_DN18996_c0_g1~~TRINITY_DN18996_c0_g1_i1.p1  ORF type:complete len:279 (-),score=26.48 TRINITY_DN18996_c0_g1_i1:328-1164(-)
MSCMRGVQELSSTFLPNVGFNHWSLLPGPQSLQSRNISPFPAEHFGKHNDERRKKLSSAKRQDARRAQLHASDSWPRPVIATWRRIDHRKRHRHISAQAENRGSQTVCSCLGCKYSDKSNENSIFFSLASRPGRKARDESRKSDRPLLAYDGPQSLEESGEVVCDSARIPAQEQSEESTPLPPVKDTALAPTAQSSSLAVRAALALLKFYKREISPLLPGSCRYVPTCSEYAMEAYTRYGAGKGSILTAWRIMRCNPFGGSGFDPPRWFGEAGPPPLD